MQLKSTRTAKQNVKRLRRAIRKFGDADGKRAEILKDLKTSK